MSDPHAPHDTLPTGTVTFLFTDIEGSTELLQRVGDQAYQRILETHHDLVREVLTRCDGHEVGTQGDAFFVAFHDAGSALTAAVDVQRAMAAHGWPAGVMIRVRMGLHTGEPALGPTGYVGIDVHRAARICSAGYGQQILLSERTHVLGGTGAPGGVTLKDLGEHRLKDLARPEHLFQAVIPGLPDAFPPLKTLDVLRTNLPSLELTSFVGREHEMIEVKQFVARARLVTLIGSGGAGKTRLALQVAAEISDQFANGVWLVELAPIDDPEMVVQTVASVFGVRELPGRPLLQAVVDYLRNRDLLVVLDNCEHLVEAAARVVTVVLRGCPRVRIVATTREALGAPGEALYRVPSLSSPDPRAIVSAAQLASYDATRLFIERAAQSDPRFEPSDATAPLVARICRRLDGIPLAIELAAARVKVLPLDQIARRLDDRFRLLTGGARTGLPHHQTLRAAIDWSYSLLADDERRLLCRLSVFAGAFSLESAEHVAVDDRIVLDAVLDLLARLVDKSLVFTEVRAEDIRYRLLETIREYGRERLQESGEADTMERRHLQWHLEYAERAEPELRGPNQVVWLDSLALDYDDFRAALEWATRRGVGAVDDTEAWMRLACALYRFWSLRGYLREGREWLERAASLEPAAPALRAKAAYGAGVLAYHQGDYAAAESLSTQALSAHRDREDSLGTALSLETLGRIAQSRGDYPRAAALLEEGLAVGRQWGHKWAVSRILNALAITARSQRDYRRAKTLLEECLALWRELGDKSGLALALGSLGVVARFEGDYARARPLHEESLALRRQLGDRLALATSLGSLGTVLLDQGDYEQARPLFEESLALCRELGDKLNAAAALGNLGIVAYHQKEYAAATARVDEGLTLWREMGNKPAIAASFSILGLIALADGDSTRAATFYKDGLTLSASLRDRLGIAKCLAGLARVAATRGQAEAAARYFGAAEALREALATPLPASDRAAYDAVIAIVRAALPPDILAAAWQHGRAAPTDVMIEDALRTVQ